MGAAGVDAQRQGLVSYAVSLARAAIAALVKDVHILCIPARDSPFNRGHQNAPPVRRRGLGVGYVGNGAGVPAHQAVAAQFCNLFNVC